MARIQYSHDVNKYSGDDFIRNYLDSGSTYLVNILEENRLVQVFVAIFAHTPFKDVLLLLAHWSVI